MLNNVTLKNCLFDATNIVKNNDKSKYEYSGYGIPLAGAGEWNFDNDFARNVVIFGVDKISSSHTDNRKNNFLVLGEGILLVLTLSGLGLFDQQQPWGGRIILLT